jgi:hypothetical protein
MVKRLFDVVCAAAALVVTAPLIGLAAIGIKLTDPGPVLFRARRVGYLGRQFTMYKLRTMKLERSESGAESRGPVITAHEDDRVSPIGKILRRTKIDELPQLFNILRRYGDRGPPPRGPEHRARALLHRRSRDARRAPRSRQSRQHLPVRLLRPPSHRRRSRSALRGQAAEDEAGARPGLHPSRVAAL